MERTKSGLEMAKERFCFSVLYAAKDDQTIKHQWNSFCETTYRDDAMKEIIIIF